MLDHLRDLLNHMAWADGMFFHAWSKGPQDDAELRERWSHVLGTATFFNEVLRGTHDVPWDKIFAGEVRPPWLDQPLKTFDELRMQTKMTHEALAEFLSNADETALERVVRIPWFPEPPCLLTVAEAITQAVLHAQHHRGQCLTKLKEKGGTPANVDYIIWAWKERPMARWA